MERHCVYARGGVGGTVEREVAQPLSGKQFLGLPESRDAECGGNGTGGIDAVGYEHKKGHRG